ncbi:TetR/AcrR family transcriptional regulator [Pseudonocardia petroleophila]|uniref:TetR/AcrR family transcriptional regulator n=1 Tax=Pseudonocardia petroleophila TaxID=37331 RepID=A0A7G7MBG2_9PSEU|nr:TetR/AcrR family transcriptional regulator [Pseudonocardia petroleophila]QNG50123.1 TetR/AcrR family transcriptional regulator [Pseudonocardia petroleophila]
MPTAARDRLIAAAERLFYAEGVRAVGVERLLAESGVGRASFYRHFPGKDDLVVTVLGERLARWRADLAAAVDARGGGVPAVFEALAEQLAEPGFRGCAAINAMVEAADRDSAAHRVAADHKAQLAAYLGGLAGDAELGEQLLILVDGAIVTALRDPTGDPARRAAAIAALLMR